MIDGGFDACVAERQQNTSIRQLVNLSTMIPAEVRFIIATLLEDIAAR